MWISMRGCSTCGTASCGCPTLQACGGSRCPIPRWSSHGGTRLFPHRLATSWLHIAAINRTHLRCAQALLSDALSQHIREGAGRGKLATLDHGRRDVSPGGVAGSMRGLALAGSLSSREQFAVRRVHDSPQSSVASGIGGDEFLSKLVVDLLANR